MKDFITIITFSYHHELIVLRGQLESVGIVCFVPSKNAIQIQPMYSDALGGFQLQVHKRDFKKAASILRDSDYTVENVHFENEEFVQNKQRIKPKNGLKRMLLFLLIVIVIFSLYSKISSLREKSRQNDFITDLTDNRWCVIQIVSAEKEYEPLTKGVKKIVSNEISCQEAFLFDERGVLIIPGFNSPVIVSSWDINNDKIVLKTNDSLQEVFNNEYSYLISNDSLILRSQRTDIVCRRQKLYK